MYAHTHMHCVYSRLDNYYWALLELEEKMQIKSGDELKLCESLAWNMRLDPSDKTIWDTVGSMGSHCSEISSMVSLSLSLPTFLELFLNQDFFFKKLLAKIMSVLTVSSGSGGQWKQPAFQLTCKDSVRHEHLIGSGRERSRVVSGFCESFIAVRSDFFFFQQFTWACLVSDRGFTVTASIFKKPYSRKVFWEIFFLYVP